MIPVWVNIVVPVAAVLLGVVVAGGVNYWFANRRERRQARRETEAAALASRDADLRIERRAISGVVCRAPVGVISRLYSHPLPPSLGRRFYFDTPART